MGSLVLPVASGSSGTTMTFGGGEVAMPAAGESTADDLLTISVDSATTEEDKKQKPSASSSNPRQKTKSEVGTKDSIANAISVNWYPIEDRRKASVKDGDAMFANFYEDKGS